MLVGALKSLMILTRTKLLLLWCHFFLMVKELECPKPPSDFCVPEFVFRAVLFLWGAWRTVFPEA